MQTPTDLNGKIDVKATSEMVLAVVAATHFYFTIADIHAEAAKMEYGDQYAELFTKVVKGCLSLIRKGVVDGKIRKLGRQIWDARLWYAEKQASVYEMLLARLNGTEPEYDIFQSAFARNTAEIDTVKIQWAFEAKEYDL